MAATSPEHSREELNDLGFGPYEVNFVDCFALELKNGEKISINVWFPGNCKDFFPKQEATIRYCDAKDESFVGEVKIVDNDQIQTEYNFGKIQHHFWSLVTIYCSVTI